ncbi:protein translocase subunit SecD [Actinocorallia sp. B10E7]|uniref:protein translocase subunit SecD n=1 Tax=Actinocorallia sp. B10E7 TaxID=3153558 RepID=UPI00325E3BAB
MTRATRIRALLALAVLALAAYITVTTPVRLGLDLRGGTQIVLETRDSATVKATSEVTDTTVETLRRRVDALGVAEPQLVRSGDNRIIVELPGLQDPQKAVDVLGRMAELSFHPVLGYAEEQTGPKAGELVVPDEDGQKLRLGPAGLTGADVGGASPGSNPQSGPGWFVNVDFKGQGEAKWAKLTGDAACQPGGDPRRRVAIVLDGKVISSPQVVESVPCGVGITGGSTQITGDFTFESAEELALLIRGGALPVPVTVIEQRTVGPTLGAEAISASAQAAIIGTMLTSLFIIIIYRLLGLLAAVALACYGLISYAVLAGLGATLTLPGLAGFVLAIGMAVDANVLVFERAREEYQEPRTTLRTSLAAGFRNAFSAIADSNVTTLVAAALLFFLASGPVRGFGVTLAIGVLASMFSALVITRALAEVVFSRRAVQRRPAITGIARPGRVREWLQRRDPHLMRYARRWLALSLLAVVVAGSGIVVRGLNLGVEFTGGRLIEYSSSVPVDVDRARALLVEAGQPRAVVNASGEGELTVRTGPLSNAEEARVTQALGGLAGDLSKVRDELIGPSLGDELRRSAIIALIAALLMQMAYLAFRFRWSFAVAAVVAMAHDVLILVGVFAWLGKSLDGVFLAALLTVIGYSVNDSVVVFDRVRELTATGGRSFARLTSTAIYQTIPRTINTGMGAVFILAALLFLGGSTLRDFALALLIGVLVGTYSSVFTASPLAVVLHREGPRPSGDKSEAAVRQPA